MPSVADAPTDTRRRLLQAALRAFGRRDYDAVGTREIVEAAGANISAISYHFGGKRGLYLATADYLARSMRSGLQPYLERIQAALPDADAEACRRLLSGFIRGFVENLVAGEFSEDAPGFIFREQNHPTEAFEILFEQLLLPVQETLAALVGRIRGLEPDAPECRLAAHGLMGLAISFRAGRTTVLKRLGKPAYTPADVERIGALAAAMSAAALDYYPANQIPGEAS